MIERKIINILICAHCVSPCIAFPELKKIQFACGIWTMGCRSSMDRLGLLQSDVSEENYFTVSK